MDYFCENCNTPNKLKSKNKHLQSVTHYKLDKCIRTKHSIDTTDFFHIDLDFNNYITNHSKKFDLYLVIYDFILVFDNCFHPHVKSEFQYLGKTNSEHNTHLKKYLLGWIENFFEIGYNFSYIYELNITTIIKKELWLTNIILNNRYKSQIWRCKW